jgi:hypothetical protein
MAKVRITLTLDEDVIDVYKTIADATNNKLSPVVNQWLGSTSAAFALMAAEIDDIKQRPAKALNTLLLFQEQMDEKIDTMDPALANFLAAARRHDDAAMRATAALVSPTLERIMGYKEAEKEKDQATPAAVGREDGERTTTPTPPVTPHSNTGVNPPTSPVLGAK